MTVSIRKFPFPYRAGLAISSDIDNASSLEVFLSWMDFLNGHRATSFGEGLRLEIGNSFWFFNGSGTPQLSYFVDLSRKESEFAPYCRELWESQHIDTLHSYGNFDSGGFRREYAELSLNELKKYNATIPVWVNHGIGPNHQNVGNYDDMHGANPNKEEYHLDLVRQIGCEYFWMGKLTHVIGQDAKSTLSVKGKNLLQTIMKSTKYRKVEAPIFDKNNVLLLPIKFEDGTESWEFQRWVNAWGRETTLDLFDFTRQTVPRIINTLIHNEGFMVLYTHFCENLFLEKGIPEKLQQNMHHIKQRFSEGDLLVATTSRLLQYCEIAQFINYSVGYDPPLTRVDIDPILRTSFGDKSIRLPDLQGLTFYVDEPKTTTIHFQNKDLKTVINAKDQSGKQSISVPWYSLEYPR